MPEIKANFLKGKMNKDADERVLPAGEYKDALNIQVGVAENGDAGSIHNILGNAKISNINIPGATCIGSISDTQNDKLYWFIYGTTIDAIAEYDVVTGVVSPVLVDTTKLITNFSNTQITAINVVEGYLLWTDNNSEPKNIDIELFKSKSINFTTTTNIYDDFIAADRPIVESDITLIRKKPASAPFVSISTYGFAVQSSGIDITASINVTGLNPGDSTTMTVSVDPNLKAGEEFFVAAGFDTGAKKFKFVSISGLTVTAEYILSDGFPPLSFTGTIKKGDILFNDKFVRFAYRWRFKNNQVSVISPFTPPIFEPFGAFVYDSEQGYNTSMENTIRAIELIGIDTKPADLYSIDIVYKESNNTNLYVYKTLRKEEFENYATGIGKIKINSESIYSVLPNNQLFRQYDNVPYRAKGQEISANRVIFGNYKDGLDITNDRNGNYIQYNPTFNISTERRTNHLSKSIKTGRTYQFGVIFEDEYGRQTPIVSNDSGEIKIDYDQVRFLTATPSRPSGNEFKVSLSNLPSEVFFNNRIRKFKYYIKEQSKEYYNVIVYKAFDDDENANFLWVAIPSYEINKIQEEDYIILKKKADTTAPLSDPSLKYKVQDISNSKPDNITSSETLNGYFFIKIKKDTSGIATATNLTAAYTGTWSNAVFETIPSDNLLDVYYETEDSYDIHEYNQTKTLKWFNCFDFGNGVESDRIRDDFNEATIDNQVRVSTTVENGYKQKHNKYGLIFSSGLFNSRNGVNDINQFNTGEAITKDLNPEYGSIQKLHSRNTDLIALCEDKILKILSNKDALFNADGNINLTATTNVLGQAITFSGEYGISTNPESFAEYGYRVYFTDKARNAVLRLSADGLTVISNYGMADFFRDKFNELTEEESISFKEGIDGWTSRLSFVPESGTYINGCYYTMKNGELYKHYSNASSYNNFYGTQNNSTVNFNYNQDPSTVKSFKTINYEGTSGWIAESIETDQQSGKVTTFINKEGKWFNNIKGIANTDNNLDTKEFSIQGLGNITSFTN